VSDFDAALTDCAMLDEEALGRPWSWRGRPLDVREALYLTLEDVQEAHARASAGQLPESRRILALAQRAFGDLRGLLSGLPADLLDRAPREGEWPVRETLRHMLWVERRYALSTRHAIDRADGEPIRLSEDRLPTLAQMDVGGEIGAVLARIGEAREETTRRLGDVVPAAMTRPSVWAGHEIDVRFRLHRFAVHIVEHTIQCEKALRALAWCPTEGRRIARRIAAALGEVEGLGAVTEAREVEARLAERLASVRV